jgi:hypothetical protein
MLSTHRTLMSIELAVTRLSFRYHHDKESCVEPTWLWRKTFIHEHLGYALS